MGGKGQRRREKNYKRAHGGHSRLPPPPETSALNAIPSKLRQLIALSSSPALGSGKVSTTAGKRNEKELRHPKDGSKSILNGVDDEGTDEQLMLPQHVGNSEDILHDNALEKKNKKRKGKKINDLRFQTTLEELGAAGSKKRERKKKYIEAKKKKNKKGKTDESMEFPGHEEIKFGDVVQAPPKLCAIPKPKPLKTVHDASRERIRLQAVEAYRSRKGWVSRPGINVPTIAPSFN